MLTWDKTVLTWNEIVHTGLQKREKYDQYRQKVDASILADHISVVFNQVIGHIREFVQSWEPDQLEFSSVITESNSKEQKTQNIPRQRK